MNRRFVPGVLGLAALAVFALAGLSAQAGGKAAGKKPADHHDKHFNECAKACTTCLRECESCAHHCARLLAQGKKEHAKTLETCLDCADYCAAAARIVARHGPMAVGICDACAKACDVCGKACEQHPNDEHMAQCARACRDCARACREMIEHAGHDHQAK